MRCIPGFAVGLILTLGSLAQAQNPPAPPFVPPDQKVYYYNGDMKVELVVALDELDATPPKGISTQGLKSLLPDASLRTVMGGESVRVNFGKSPATVAGLESTAQTLRSAGYAVRPVLYAPGQTGNSEAAQVLTPQFSIKVASGHTIEEIAAAHGVTIVEAIDFSPNTYVVETTDPSLLASLNTANALYESGAAEFATPLLKRQMHKRLIPDDSLFGNQWHLRNTAQGAAGAGAIAGNDVNIVTAWDQVTGAGVNIAVVDDGVEATHSDLAANARTDVDIDLNGGDNDASPEGGDSHGTSVAGVAAAVGKNATGVIGAGFEASIIGVRLLGGPANDLQEAQGLAHLINPVLETDQVWISSNSWGPLDNGSTLETFGPLTKAAIQNGAMNGRGGRGIIYTWAGGNGRLNSDYANFDGYASSRYTICVGASGANGVVSFYSESGASLLVNSPSGWANAGITTTTIGNAYTSSFGGTSSATPLVSGIVALMLEENPFLGWRDVQHILAETATQIDAGNPDWQTNGAGLTFNHTYGYGRVDATAAVTAASTWYNVPAEATPLTNAEAVATAIPDNTPAGVSRGLAVAGAANFVTEHVEVVANVTHPSRGQLKITLTSPSGMVSTLAAQRPFDSNANFSSWIFTSVAHMGEDPNGTWTLNVSDNGAGSTGSLTSWNITVHGYLSTTDQDGDGIPDTTEGLEDGDGDGLQNYQDTDSDGDTLLDADEYTAPEGLDPDGDTIPNFLDTDSDDDGFTDEYEDLVGTNPYDAGDVPAMSLRGWPVAMVALLLAGLIVLRRNQRLAPVRVR
ncbi:MAG: hypothetical protein AMXMBFR82_30330 [Candidatus Hydrogenedentota bacterium]